MISLAFQAQVSVDMNLATISKVLGNLAVPVFPSRYQNPQTDDLLLISCDTTDVQGIVDTFSPATPVVYFQDDSIDKIIDSMRGNERYKNVRVFADFKNNLSFARWQGQSEEWLLEEWATKLKRRFGIETITLYDRSVECIGLDEFNEYCDRVTQATQVVIGRADYKMVSLIDTPVETIVMISQDTPSDLIASALAGDGLKVLYNSMPDYGVAYMLQKIRLELMGSIEPNVEFTRALGVKYIDIMPSTPIFTELEETRAALKEEFGPDIDIRLK